MADKALKKSASAEHFWQGTLTKFTELWILTSLQTSSEWEDVLHKLTAN